MDLLILSFGELSETNMVSTVNCCNPGEENCLNFSSLFFFLSLFAHVID